MSEIQNLLTQLNNIEIEIKDLKNKEKRRPKTNINSFSPYVKEYNRLIEEKKTIKAELKRVNFSNQYINRTHNNIDFKQRGEQIIKSS